MPPPPPPPDSAPVEGGPLPTARWQVGLLGGLSLSDGREHITRLPSRAVTALLARLALAPERAHAREELIELLWPGVSLAVGRNRLRQALSTLKGILEPVGPAPARPVLQADRICVRVLPGGLACDATGFERSVRAGRLDDARRLYRGELLPGFYDDWIDEERLRLAALHERLAEPPRRSQGAATATSGASLPPGSPDAPGDSVEPAPGAGSARASQAQVSLPSYLTRLFGAAEQASRLRALVLAHRLVTLIGPGGGGKTRLAIETAHSLGAGAGVGLSHATRIEPFDLIVFVPLAACTTRAQTCDALLRALAAPTADDPVVALAGLLAGRRALLLLDNFEQLVAPAAELVARLLETVPTLHLLVTSRRVLGLDGEQEFAVAALELPPSDAPTEAAAGNAAVALFVDRARAVRADFRFGARNGATLVELVRALDGMPLAIELAASRVRSIAPAELLARLRGGGTPGLELLTRTGPGAAADARHASMQRVIEWSWEQLDVAQARLLSALTVFPGGFTAAAAAALLDGEPLDAALLLDELVANSLVHAVAGTGTDTDAAWRFGLYQPIREYAASRQDPAGAHRARARLRAWALDWALALPPTPPLDALRTEMTNLAAALASAVEDRVPDEAVGLLLALRPCIEDVDWPTEALAQAQAAVDACADPLLKARGHVLLGPMLLFAGQSAAAMRHAELVTQCEGLDPVLRARALHGLARVRWRSVRRADLVEPLLDEAEALLGVTDEPELRAHLLTSRAYVMNAHHRDLAAAERLHGEALALWGRLGNQHAVNRGRYNLAVAAQNAGQHAAALHRLEPVVASARALHDWRRLSQSLNVQGNAHSGLRAWPEAVAAYQDCVRIAWQTLASFDLAHGLWNLPRALAHRRRPAAAIRLAAFASLLWRSRFGELAAADERYLVLVRRLVAPQLAAARIEAEWREGEGLSLPQAVALALDPLS